MFEGIEAYFRNFCLMENEKLRSYLTDTEDLINLCVIAQKFIRAGNFIQGRATMTSIINTAECMRKEIEDET